MSQTNEGPLPPAGWYADPSGNQGQRWWDGTQWTGHTNAPEAPAPTPTPQYGQYATQQYSQYGPGAAPRYNTAESLHHAPEPSLPAVAPGTSPYTPFIWALVLVPLVSLVVLTFLDVPSYILDSIHGAAGAGGILYIVLTLVNWASYLGAVLLAFLDWRALRRVGYAQPFHWAWAFLTSLVYLIGRTVVARRRGARGGLGPIWVFIAITVAGIVVATVKLGQLVTVLTEIPMISYTP